MPLLIPVHKNILSIKVLPPRFTCARIYTRTCVNTQAKLLFSCRFIKISREFVRTILYIICYITI